MVKEAYRLRLFTSLDHSRAAKNRDIHIAEPQFSQNPLRIMPSDGARCRTSPGVTDNRTGVFGTGTGFALPGYSTNLINSRDLTCGSSRTSCATFGLARSW